MSGLLSEVIKVEKDDNQEPLVAAPVLRYSPVEDQLERAATTPLHAEESPAEEALPPEQAPPPPAAVEDAQSTLATALEYALVAALLWYVFNDSSGDDGGGVIDFEQVNVSKMARKAAIAWIEEVSKLWGVFLPDVSYDFSETKLSNRIEGTANRWAADRARDLRDKTPKPPRAEREASARQWASNSAHTMATQLASETTMLVARYAAPTGEDGVPLTVYKVWLTRSDTKVRSSHRDLHGQIKELDEPFKTWPLTHKMLMFPGDPSAPLREFIGCRCFLWFIWGADVETARDAFMADPKMFGPITASADDMLLACSEDPIDLAIAARCSVHGQRPLEIARP